MKKLYKVSFILIIMFIISIYIINPVYAKEDNDKEIYSLYQKEIKGVLDDLIKAIEEQESGDYIALFHKQSPIYVLHYSELKETFRILSSYDLIYEIENIRFIKQSGEDITVEVDIIVKSHENEEYIDRRNTFGYIFKVTDDNFKIYDMSIKSIEALDKEDQLNIILVKKDYIMKTGL